jgi:sugar fermentation stimulation protein A
VCGPTNDSGVYVYLFAVDRPTHVRVGALGDQRLEAGLYAYVGSARRGLTARLARHARVDKPRRWHVDYLAEVARPVAAIGWTWKPGRECRLARTLRAGSFGRLAVPRFGASDCGCPGHLLALPGGEPARLPEVVLTLVRWRPRMLRTFPRGEA